MLYIVRHGRTSANASRCLQGRLDLPLDDVGRAQAAALVGVVPSPSRVIVSPMLRAHQTASVFGVGPEVDERWHEMGYGELEGVPLDEVPPATWATWRSDPTFAPPGGESLQQVATRVMAACEELLREAAASDIVVVTHVTPVKVAMAWALGVDISVTWRSHVDQASVTRIMVRDGRPVLAGFNHVPG